MTEPCETCGEKPAVPGDTKCRWHGGKMPTAWEATAYPLEADAPMDGLVESLVGIIRRARREEYRQVETDGRTYCSVCNPLALGLEQVFRKKLAAALAQGHDRKAAGDDAP